MTKTKNKPKIKLIKKEPHKVYRIEVQHNQIKEVCTFIRNNKDKEVSLIINGKHTKFNSFAGQKRFAAGFDQGSDFALKHTKKLFEEMQGKTNDLKNELTRVKRELKKQKVIATDTVYRLITNNTIKELRQATYTDHVTEIDEDRALLKDRLDKVEPVIKLVVKSTTDGQLQKAYKLAKKLKL